MSMRLALAIAAASVALTGCAVTQELGFTPDAAVTRGRTFAARECGSCHALDLVSESPRPAAKPFREIRLRYNELSLRREFDAITEVGHYEMMPTPISASDGRDLIAFIESLGR